jgi:negative regulator of flagellin synthesis FlgM
MKIDNSIKALGPRTGSAPARPSSAPAKGAEPVGAQVELSSSSRMQNSTATGGAFDAQRVAEIRQAISEGRFQINPERIADGLVDSVREMIAQRRRPA